MTITLPDIKVGDRFSVDEWPHLGLVELVRKQSKKTWRVADVNPADGKRAPWTFRLKTDGLAIVTVRIHQSQ